MEFHRVSHAEQLRELDLLARTIVVRFGIELQRCERLQYERNAVYSVSAHDGARYVLRISGDDAHPILQQESELTLVRGLCREGHRVPMPVTAPSGACVLERGSLAVSPRACVMFQWLEGEPPSADLSEGQLAELGAATARLHASTRRFSAPSGFTRPRLAWRLALGDEIATQPYRPLLKRLSERLASDLDELSREPMCLLHGDLHRDNVLVQDQRVGFIDFEDCAWGHPLFDVASLLDSLRRRVVGRAGYPRARSVFLEAYGPTFGTLVEVRRFLCAFKAVRDAITLRFISSSRNESVQSWAGPRSAQLVRHLHGYLENDDPRV